MTTAVARVLLVTDQQAMPPFLSELAGAEYQPVGRVTSMAAIAEAARERRPDVVVAEVVSKNRLDALAAAFPDVEDVALVVVSAVPEEVALLTCLAMGAHAFVRKPLEPGMLRDAVSAAARGWTYVDPRCTGWLVDVAVHGYKARPDNGLTWRQEQVVRLAGSGLTNREIAGALAISPETVKSHLRRAMRRLGVHDRWDATARAQGAPAEEE